MKDNLGSQSSQDPPKPRNGDLHWKSRESVRPGVSWGGGAEVPPEALILLSSALSFLI
jgi:hypothetical protein